MQPPDHVRPDGLTDEQWAERLALIERTEKALNDLIATDPELAELRGQAKPRKRAKRDPNRPKRPRRPKPIPEE